MKVDLPWESPKKTYLTSGSGPWEGTFLMFELRCLSFACLSSQLWAPKVTPALPVGCMCVW